MRAQRLREVLATPCQRAGGKVAVLTRGCSCTHCHPPGPPPRRSLSPHLVHTSEQLPVEGSEMVGNILWLHAVNLCVSRGDLDFLRKRHLMASRGTGLGSPVGY